MDDISGIPLSKPRPQGARSSQCACDPPLAVVALVSYIGEQRSGAWVGSGGVGEDAMNEPRALHDVAD